MRLRTLCLLLLLTAFACNREQRDESDLRDRGTEADIAFDKTKWSVQEGLSYPFRDQMLNDLVYSDSVRTLDKTELLELLGEPERSNEDHLYYLIAQKRLGIWTVHSKTLVIKLNEDAGIEWMKIHE